MNASILRKAVLPCLCLAACSWLLLSAGCGGGKPKLRVAYLGLTCEAPLFMAQEKGFYAEEGLDVELVKTDWDGLREGLGTGAFDANHTLIMYLLKPIEQGIDIRITGGIHTGCLRLQVPPESGLTVAGLKGKTIGVPTHLGSPPYLFSSRVLAAAGLDPRPGKDVRWVAYPPAELALALQQGKVDAVATADPIGTILLGKGLVKTIADQAVDAPYKDEYCCAVAVSGKLATRDPDKAARVTRALLKAARWVEENPKPAAALAVERKYISASVEANAKAISDLRYMPGVSTCRDSIGRAAREMGKAGLLKEGTDAEALAKRAWLDLDGVTDEWAKGLKAERVAGGKLRRLTPLEFVGVLGANKDCLCCFKCCVE